MDSEMEVSEDTGWRLPSMGAALLKLRDAALVTATIALLVYAATTVVGNTAGPAQPERSVAVAHCDSAQRDCDKP